MAEALMFGGLIAFGLIGGALIVARAIDRHRHEVGHLAHVLHMPRARRIDGNDPF